MNQRSRFLGFSEEGKMASFGIIVKGGGGGDLEGVSFRVHVLSPFLRSTNADPAKTEQTSISLPQTQKQKTLTYK